MWTKKLVMAVVGTSLSLGLMAGTASAADPLGIKKRAEKRENSYHRKNMQGIEDRAEHFRNYAAKQGSNASKNYRETANQRASDIAATEREGERNRHQKKLADIRSRNALGMKKRPAAPAKAAPAKAAPAKTTRGKASRPE